MPAQNIEVGYGKANLSNTLATYAVMKVEAPFTRVSAASSGTRQTGSKQFANVGRHSLNGGFSIERVGHENGTIILAQVSWKRNGAPLRDGSLFMRLRAGAPLWRVSGKVPTGQDNMYGDRFVMFSGYADILNADDLAVAGIEVNRMYISKFMSMDELEECFELSQVSAATQNRPTATAIATPEGIQMKEVAQSPIRRMRLR